MNERSEIKGTMRAASQALLRARQALLNGLDEPDCMLNPTDMKEMRSLIKDSTVFLADIKKASASFGEVADVRKKLPVPQIPVAVV